MGTEIMVREIDVSEMDLWLKCIRKHAVDAQIQDYDNIDEIHVKKQMRQAIISPDVKVFVVDEGNEIKGYCIAQLNEKLWNNRLYGEIIMFYIDPDVRNIWLAKDMYEAAVKWFRNNGCLYVQASTMLYDNDFKQVEDYVKRGKIFFKKQGMEEVGYHYVKELE